MTYKKLSLTVLFLTLHTLSYATLYWDWNAIALHEMTFPTSFEWGTTTLMHETEPYTKSSTWHAWHNNIHNSTHNFYNPTPQPQQLSLHHLELVDEDVQLIKEMRLTTYCCSLDWSAIEPERGMINEKELEKYATFFAKLSEQGISVIATLKGYSDPIWFGYRGGFEKEENISFFERYAITVYNKLNPYVKRWITFWSPESYAMLGYVTATLPPKKQDLHTAATVLKNIFEAHVRIYKALKASPTGNHACIGITKHVHPLEPWYLWDHISCYAARMLTDNLFYSFFSQGTYSLRIPLPGKYGAWVTHSNPYAPQAFDFIGINYHSHGYMKNFVNHVGNPDEIGTDIPSITIYPEGLYEGIKEISTILTAQRNVPLIITQNGIATTNESIRQLYIHRHLYAISKALKEGCNIQGYCYYSLFDGNVWDNTGKKFGLCSVDKENRQRIKKATAHYYTAVIKRYK